MAQLPPGFVMDGPKQGGVFTLPQNPRDARTDARNDAKDARDAENDAYNRATQEKAARLARAKAVADLKKDGMTLDANDNVVPLPAEKGKGDPMAEARQDARNKLEAITRLEQLSKEGWFATGFGHDTAKKWFGGSDANSVESLIKTVSSQGALNKILEMAKTNGGKNPLTPMSNSDVELIASTVGNLNPTQSDGDFQNALKPYKELYTRAFTGTGGTVDPTTGKLLDPAPDLGNAWDQNTIVSQQAMGLADPNATTQTVPVPPAMQQEYDAFLAQWSRNPDPAAYVQFRRQLDRKYNYPLDPAMDAANQKWATETAGQLKTGGATVNGAIPGVEQPISANQQFGNSIVNNPVGGFVGGMANATGGLDELTAAATTGFGMAGDYNNARDQFNGKFGSLDAEYPKSAFAGKVVGNVAGGYGLGRAFPALGALASANPLRSAGLAGAGMGALEQNNNRLGGAALGSVAGITGGALGKYAVAPAMDGLLSSKAAQAVGGKASGLFGKSYTPPVTLTAPEATMGKIGTDWQAATGNLRDAGQYGLPYALGDASPELRLLSGTVSRKSPDARALAMNTFDPRHADQAGRFTNAVDQHLAPITNIDEYGKNLLKAGNAASEPYYQMAKGAPAPVDPELAAMLRTSSGQDALRRAQSIASDTGVDPNGKSIYFDKEGLLTVDKVPTFQTLDMVKRGFDSRLNEARNPITRQLDLTGDPVLGAVEGLRKRFVSKLDSINENYPKARGEYAKYAQQKDALDLGYGQLPKPGVPDWQFNNAVGRLTPETMPMAQRGYATALADNAAKRTDVADPWRAISGPLNQQKLGAMFPEGSQPFGRITGLERDMAGTRYETLGGSPTAARMEMDGALGGDLAGGALDQASSLATGGGLQLARLLKDMGTVGVGKRARAKADALAPMLFDTSNPVAAADAIEALLSKKATQTTRRNRYGLFGATIPTALLPTVFGP